MKTFSLKRRKHRSRKLRKGGNGPNSTSSSQVTFDELKTLIYKIKVAQKKLIVENDENTKNELKADINNDIKKLLSIFRYNKIDLTKLDLGTNFILFEMIVDFTNFKETDRQIVQSYANYLLDNEITWYDNRFLNDMIEEKKNMIMYNPIIFQKQIENLEQIKAILDIPTTSTLIDNMSLTSKNYPRYSSSGQENLSTFRKLFPRPIVKHIMQYLTGSNFTHQAKNPKKWEDVMKTAIENIKPQGQQNILYLEDNKNNKRSLSQGSQGSQSSQDVNNSKKPRASQHQPDLLLEDDENNKRSLSQGSQNSQSSQDVNNSKKPRVANTYNLLDIDGGRRTRKLRRSNRRRSNRRK